MFLADFGYNPCGIYDLSQFEINVNGRMDDGRTTMAYDHG